MDKNVLKNDIIYVLRKEFGDIKALASSNEYKEFIKYMEDIMVDDKISDIAFNMMGKHSTIDSSLPDTSSTAYAVDDVKQAVIDVANGYINGITKDRIKVSLVVDNEHTTYNKDTKRNEGTTALVIAVYFDINDSNFVQKADNEFGTVIQPSNEKVSWFLTKYALKHEGGKPCDAIIRSEGGIHIVLDVRMIFEYMADASGFGYKNYSGQRGRRVDIKVEVVKRHYGNRVTIDYFLVTKTLAVKPKKLRDF